MSTRSQIAVRGVMGDEQWFYRHSNGYPRGNLPQLYKFLKWVQEGKIRNNAEQASGWLVLIGADEYGFEWNDDYTERKRKEILYEPSDDPMRGWKVGAYEPCIPQRYGDIEWFYTIDLENLTITVEDVVTGIRGMFTIDKLDECADNDFQNFQDRLAEQSGPATDNQRRITD